LAFSLLRFSIPEASKYVHLVLSKTMLEIQSALDTHARVVARPKASGRSLDHQSGFDELRLAIGLLQQLSQQLAINASASRMETEGQNTAASCRPPNDAIAVCDKLDSALAAMQKLPTPEEHELGAWKMKKKKTEDHDEPIDNHYLPANERASSTAITDALPLYFAFDGNDFKSAPAPSSNAFEFKATSPFPELQSAPQSGTSATSATNASFSFNYPAPNSTFSLIAETKGPPSTNTSAINSTAPLQWSLSSSQRTATTTSSFSFNSSFGSQTTGNSTTVPEFNFASPNSADKEANANSSGSSPLFSAGSVRQSSRGRVRNRR
jgi:hypothetical protein